MSTRILVPAPPPIAADPAPPARRTRIDSVDLLRGAVMVLMLLDHTREFVHRDGLLFDPADLSRTTVALFITRWVTHFCAPAFVFLAGTGAALQLARGKPKGDLSRFLLTRGAWLVFLEFTLVRLGVVFDLDYRAFPGMLQVIWAIGVSMMVLAALVHLRTRWVAAIG
ncbi:MAG TPA: heparan-alpha-glucosaminide N-acetyltransferase domain-containing protein, partial [Longimicrobium sp.]|nr:heparan-alpha-glucosaminide N-acetyltransferase domain-containing protein [Longimicrobium sp.]